MLAQIGKRWKPSAHEAPRLERAARLSMLAMLAMLATLAMSATLATFAALAVPLVSRCRLAPIGAVAPLPGAQAERKHERPLPA